MKHQPLIHRLSALLLLVTALSSLLFAFRFAPLPAAQAQTPTCDLSKQPVLLIHGWGGPEELTEDQAGFARLYEWMAADGYVADCNLFYATGVSSHNTREQNRQAVQDNLRRAYEVLRQSHPQWRGHFDVIGHSYGGLNARFYLESDYYQADRAYGEYGIHVDNLFTLGSPHGGTRVPQEVYPGAAVIAGGHIFTPYNLADFLSAAQLVSSAMTLYNFTHVQPDGVRYHLLGGDFLQQPNVPFVIRAIYSLWRGHPGDIGVSQASAHQLGLDPLLQGLYPRVCLVANQDMHGYESRLGLGNLKSYVNPVDTYAAYIRDILGTRSAVCPAAAQTFSVYSPGLAPDDTPFVAPVIVGSGVITGGETAVSNFPVDWPGQSTFYVVWDGGDVSFNLVEGSGQMVTPAAAQNDPDIAYEKLQDSDSGLATYVLTHTVTGSWSYAVSAASGPYPITYTVYANPDTLLLVEVFTPAWQPSDTAVIITATVQAAGAPVTGAAVEVTVTRPDGMQDNLPLRDDGLDPDAAANDGIYSGRFGSSGPGTTAQGGFYWVDVAAEGRYNGQNYRRTTETVFSIAPETAVLNHTFTDQPLDENDYGQFEYLQVQAGITAVETGILALAAQLRGSDGTTIDLASTTVEITATGPQTMTLRFSGQAIYNGRLDGPYTVAPFILQDDNTLLQLDTDQVGWVTAAYDHSRFDTGSNVYLPFMVSPTIDAAP